MELSNTYNIDIVLCLDTTGSAFIVEKWKSFLESFRNKIRATHDRSNEDFPLEFLLRVKVITFKDFAYDECPLKESKFFILDKEKSEFEEFIYSIEASGGGDPPENALEALALAMKSEWSNASYRRRHLIILCTDAPALTLGERVNCLGYPTDMPKDMDELKEWWDERYMSKHAKRLLIFAPDVTPWTNMADWVKTIVECADDIDETYFYDSIIRSLFKDF